MMQRQREILIITSEIDATSTFVCERLEARGVPFVRFNTEDFPKSMRLHWIIKPPSSAVLTNDSCRIDMQRIRSVWYRRPAPPGIDAAVSERAATDFARQESEAALAALWQGHDALWVNHPAAIRYASRKPRQLQLAAELGFSVPDTILSSDPMEIKLFYDSHDHNVVFKPLHQDSIEIGGKSFFAYASKLNTKHFDDPRMLALSPTLFQAFVAPYREIRVTVFGDRVFAASIDTQGETAEPDWRRIPPDRQQWKPHTLPPSIEAVCQRLIEHYQLHFGAIDLLLTSEGDYCFLELNPNGQWVWIELITSMPMSAALIDLLVEPLGS